MGIENPEVQTTAEKLQQLNNQITTAQIELKRVVGLYNDNTANIAGQIKTIVENNDIIQKQEDTQGQLESDIKKLNKDKKVLEKETVKMESDNKVQVAQIKKDQEKVEADRKELITDQNKFKTEKDKHIKSVQEHKAREEKFNQYCQKVLSAINEK